MNEEEIFSIIKDSTIMRNPMVRIPLEAYFREQFAKKEQELKDKGYSCVEIVEKNYDSYLVNLVDYEWARFLFSLSASNVKVHTLIIDDPKKQIGHMIMNTESSFDMYKKLADRYIDLTIKSRFAEVYQRTEDIINEAANNSATAFVISGVILATWMAVGSMLGHYVHPLITPVMMLTVVLTLRTQWFWDFLRRKCGANV